MKLEVKFNVEVTNQDIDDIMCTALEGGITYWCRRAEVVGGRYLGEYAHEQISRGGSLMLYGAKSSDKWELTLDKLKQGLTVWVQNNPDILLSGEIDEVDINADCTDTIIQYALFGEVVFG